MGLFGDVFKSFTGPVMDLIGAKYQSDLQGHLNDANADRNYTMARDTALINEGISQRAFERQKAWDMEMWDKNKVYQEELWNRQNAYNAPAAQMERMKAAGLNPMLMYGNSTPGNATVINSADPNVARLNVPEMDTPRREPVYTKVGQGLGSDIMEGILKYMQIKNVGLDNEVKIAQRALIGAQKNKTDVDTAAAEHELGILKESHTSRRDSQFFRFGGRIAAFLSDQYHGAGRRKKSIFQAGEYPLNWKDYRNLELIEGR